MKIKFDEQDLLATATVIPLVNVYARKDTTEIAMVKIRATAESCWGRRTDNIIGQAVSTYGVDMTVYDVIDDTIYVNISISSCTVQNYFDNLKRLGSV